MLITIQRMRLNLFNFESEELCSGLWIWVSLWDGVGIENKRACGWDFTPILTFPHQGGRDFYPHPNPLPKGEGTNILMTG